MLEEIPHSQAVFTLAILIHTGRGMFKEMEMHLYRSLSFLLLFLSELSGLSSVDCNWSQRMRVQTWTAFGDMTRMTNIYVTSFTVVPVTHKYLLGTQCTVWNELGRIRIMQMVQNHHTSVLRASQLIELVMVTLTQL